MDKVIIEKNNRLSDDQIMSYLGVMHLPYPFVEPIYKKCQDA